MNSKTKSTQQKENEALTARLPDPVVEVPASVVVAEPQPVVEVVVAPAAEVAAPVVDSVVAPVAAEAAPVAPVKPAVVKAPRAAKPAATAKLAVTPKKPVVAKAATVVKPVAAPVAKVAVPVVDKKAKPVKLEKPAKAEKTPKADKPAKAEKVAKPVKPSREKVVRDSFSMPKSEHAQLKTLRETLAKAGRICTKSELLRAGVQLLLKENAASTRALVEQLAIVPKGKSAK
ncbi:MULTISPECIES: hypothetical protein [Zoogloea]|jgi:hypothetical protein|uniref:hypothetical protein n=1 Tax=Zoogloea TaxID=349 RepID=UPI00258E34FA|nr:MULTISPECIES: hypothetical protein [Zoogloea]MDD2667343.1 hypothetical protein [Zoogloea sp.]MDY0035636.1 hypothetical protein [Zoogloea oleivorans]